MAHNVDVTAQVNFHNNDDEYLPLTKCVCGAKFQPWTFVIAIYDDDPSACSKCGREFFFKLDIRVYEVRRDN